MISPADLVALEETRDETRDVLSDPATMRRLRASRQDIVRGDVMDAEQVQELLAAADR